MKGSGIFSNVVAELNLGPIFGNPGTTELPILRNVRDYILTLHDSIAVGMADGRSQFLGKSSLVNLHDLPGVANSMAFIYTAKMNRSPVIITAGQQDTRHTVYDPLLYWDLLSIIGDSVKYKYEVKRPEDISIAMKRAKSIAMTPPMGPVFVSLPMDVMDGESNYSHLTDDSYNYNLVDEDAVKAIADKINAAKNPAFVFGYEIDVFNAFDEAQRIAELTGIPAYGEPLASRSVFNTQSRMYAGDLLPGTTLINLKLLNHDLIVFVGGDIIFYPYLPSPPLPDKDIIFVGFDLSRKMGESYIMNPKLFLKAVEKHLKRKGDFERQRDLTFPNKVAREREIMGVNYVLYNVKKYFSDYTIVDESISASPTVRSIMGYGHNKYFSAKTGMLGWANAASLGIAMSTGKVLAIVGDGSLLYTIQSLWTAKKYDLPLKMLVLNNGGYNILKSYSMSYYPELKDADFLNIGIDIAGLVKGFGVDVEQSDPDLKALGWLSEGEHPKVLVVNINKEVPKLFL